MEEENKNQEQNSIVTEKVIVISSEEFKQKKKILKEFDKENRREDTTGNRTPWGLQNNNQNRKRNGRKKNLDKETRESIKQTRKERKRIKKALEQQLKQQFGEEEENENEGEKVLKKYRKAEYVEKMANAPRVVVDFQFVDQIMERDRASLMKQIEVCHSENRNADKPLKLTCAQGTHSLMEKYVKLRTADKWGIELEPKDILQAYKKEDIIYLSGDVDVDMDTYEPDKVYIIGGLVEHNRLTNLTKNYSEKHGIQARRLPLSRYLDLRACSLLNINHVFSILLKLHNGSTWDHAIKTSVPKRKIGEVYFDDSDEEKQREETDKKLKLGNYQDKPDKKEQDQQIENKEEIQKEQSKEESLSEQKE